MLFNDFTLSRLPRIIYGRGTFTQLAGLVTEFGNQALLITGKQSFRESPHWPKLLQEFQERDIEWEHMTISGEPSPEIVDEAVRHYRRRGIQVVIAIGGGSVLDAAKAIAGLLPFGNSVMDHLEGVGKNIPYTGPALPFIAVPTTAGTGSEATKNAVLSKQGVGGFKKSFRHDTLIPQYALVDPDLLATCSPALIAADGMDAFTQLLESYVSLKANPLIDALAWSGIEAVKAGFFHAWQGREPEASEGRAAMAYASLLSGITLAQVGLGSVHGLASPLGAFFPIPHGVVCGTLVATATEINIQALKAREPNNPALAKYARVGRLLSDQADTDDATAHQLLTKTLAEWTNRLSLPLLSEYGITQEEIPRIVADSRGSSMQTNPIKLTDGEIGEILIKRL